MPAIRFRFHRDFVNATLLSLERGDAFYAKNYSNPDRRFKRPEL